jgi:hypothetical protein
VKGEVPFSGRVLEVSAAGAGYDQPFDAGDRPLSDNVAE